jgi:hypothetical protein
MESKIEIKGNISIVLTGPDGQVKDTREVKNIVTNAGRAHVIDRLQGASVAVADYIGIGTGPVAAAAADTALGGEVARAQGALTQIDPYTDRCVYTFPAGIGTATIQEAGRLNAPAGGTLMGRQVFTSIIKTVNDSLQVTYDFTYAAG